LAGVRRPTLDKVRFEVYSDLASPASGGMGPVRDRTGTRRGGFSGLAGGPERFR
jgi:hypothetical protein